MPVKTPQTQFRVVSRNSPFSTIPIFSYSFALTLTILDRQPLHSLLNSQIISSVTDDGYKLHWVGEFRCILKLTRDAYQQPFSPSRRKPISLLSISDVRYRGILAGLDPANSTIQLRNGERPIFFRIARVVLTQMLFDLFTDSILYGDGVSKVCIGNAGFFC